MKGAGDGHTATKSCADFPRDWNLVWLRPHPVQAPGPLDNHTYSTLNTHADSLSTLFSHESLIKSPPPRHAFTENQAKFPSSNTPPYLSAFIYRVTASLHPLLSQMPCRLLDRLQRETWAWALILLCHTMTLSWGLPLVISCPTMSHFHPM